jgi:hypothetical protein
MPAPAVATYGSTHRNELSATEIAQQIAAAAAAVISAIEHALSPFQVRIAQMPVTPHKLVELIVQGTKQ